MTTLKDLQDALEREDRWRLIDAAAIRLLVVALVALLIRRECAPAPVEVTPTPAPCLDASPPWTPPPPAKDRREVLEIEQELEGVSDRPLDERLELWRRRAVEAARQGGATSSLDASPLV